MRVAIPRPSQPDPVIPEFEELDCRPQERFCWAWVQDNWPALQDALIEHISITAIAVAIGLVLATTAALLAYRFPRFEVPVLGVTTLLYTVPVLAFFRLMVPLTGIGLLTIEIALIGYTLLLLFRNILTGLRSVPPEVHAAAVGMGMKPRQIMLRVNIPLALPALMAGLRIASVTIISLATLAGEISQLGLGPQFSFAIATGNAVSQLVAAGVLAILLALVADALLVLLTKAITPWTRSQRGGTARGLFTLMDPRSTARATAGSAA